MALTEISSWWLMEDNSKERKDIMKKIISKIFVLALFISFLCVGIPMVSEAANAVPKQMGETFTGALETKDSAHLYELKTTTNGYFEIHFMTDAPSDDINSGWKVSILDEDYNVIYYWADIQGSFTTYRITLGKNTKFYVKVESDSNSYDSWAPVGAAYSIRIDETAPSNWETEVNETKTRADVLKCNKKTYGTLWRSSDVDVYKYTVKSNGYMRFLFSMEENDTSGINSGWKITFYNKNMQEIYTAYEIERDYYSRYFNFKKGTVLYVRVEANSNSYNAWAPIDKLYSIKPIEKKTSSWELETNDTKSKATTLKTTKTGSLYTVNDTDYYSYKATKTKKTKIKFIINTDDTSTINDGWNIYVYDSKGNVFCEKKYVKEDTALTFQAKKGKKYYIKMCASSTSYASWAPVNVQYKLKVVK